MSSSIEKFCFRGISYIRTSIHLIQCALSVVRRRLCGYFINANDFLFDTSINDKSNASRKKYYQFEFFHWKYKKRALRCAIHITDRMHIKCVYWPFISQKRWMNAKNKCCFLSWIQRNKTIHIEMDVQTIRLLHTIHTNDQLYVYIFKNRWNNGQSSLFSEKGQSTVNGNDSHIHAHTCTHETL